MTRIEIVTKLVAAEMQCDRINRSSNWYYFKDQQRQLVAFCGQMADLIIEEDKENSDE